MPKGDKLVCLRCGHGSDPSHPWLQRLDQPPVSCPRCKLYTWNQPPKKG